MAVLVDPEIDSEAHRIDSAPREASISHPKFQALREDSLSGGRASISITDLSSFEGTIFNRLRPEHP